jgi:hypothetical protein
MRRLYLIASLLALGALALPASASADNEYDFTCSFINEPVFSPGLTLTPTNGKVESEGTVLCSGVHRGETFIAAPGTIQNHGRYSGTCFSVTGTTHTKMRLDLNGREYVINGHGEFHSIGPGVVAFSGKTEGNGTFSGTATSVPIPPPAIQNCTPQFPVVHLLQNGTNHLVDPS